MANILALDTASRVSSLTLLVDGQEPVSRNFEAGQTCERLFSMIKESLDETGLDFDKLDAIGVSTGPGSFTGIRSGIAAARGLSFGRSTSVFGVPALMSCLPLTVEKDSLFLAHRTSIKDEVYAQFVQLTREADSCKLYLQPSSDIFVCPRAELCSRLASKKLPQENLIDFEAGAGEVAALGVLELVKRVLNEELLGGDFLELSPLYIKPVNAKTLAERSKG